MNKINFRTFDLNLLKVLDALLKEGSTIGAAKRLNLTQSAVSAALKRLRNAVGDELFVRYRGKLEPTDYARMLQPSLRNAMSELRQIFEQDEFDPVISKATIRLSGPDFFSDMLLPELAEFTSHHAPGVKLQMLDLVPDDHFTTLVRYESDLLIMPEADLPDWAMSRTIFKSEFATIVRADHPVLRERDPAWRLPLDVFCAIPQILYSPSGGVGVIY
ncbi:MAG: LysR family transcriptional regulator [Hyphomonas sp.]|jgi:DNA-binding transcriptional LysR family regulator|nr:LysR family transcriptional regulator [Hyphomonas sp.]